MTFATNNEGLNMLKTNKIQPIFLFSKLSNNNALVFVMISLPSIFQTSAYDHFSPLTECSIFLKHSTYFLRHSNNQVL